ncbi:MAG: MSHA biogenesis protein MshJ [Oxalobacteraceae bacterium]
MKQSLQRIILKIDAMSLRERIMIFAGTALTSMLMLNALLFDPQFAQQKQLSQQIKQDQSKIAEMQTQIQQQVKSQGVDPDAANNALLQSFQQQSQQMQGDLAGLNKVLVKPENMASLLEDLLKRNGKLRLVSLKTLPVGSLIPTASEETRNSPDKIAVAAPSTPATVTAQGGTDTGDIYKHGVEIVVQGKYLDMLAYMTALEAMPWQLYWGKARMQVGTYPEATLSLTLFTLSLDKKWLNL